MDLNLFAPFGHSWIFRHRADSSCPGLPATPQHREAAAAALTALSSNLSAIGNNFSDYQMRVLTHNWRYAWCEGPTDAEALPATIDPLLLWASNKSELPVGQLTHDFKLFLGQARALSHISSPARTGPISDPL